MGLRITLENAPAMPFIVGGATMSGTPSLVDRDRLGRTPYRFMARGAWYILARLCTGPRTWFAMKGASQATLLAEVGRCHRCLLSLMLALLRLEHEDAAVHARRTGVWAWTLQRVVGRRSLQLVVDCMAGGGMVPRVAAHMQRSWRVARLDGHAKRAWALPV